MRVGVRVRVRVGVWVRVRVRVRFRVRVRVRVRAARLPQLQLLPPLPSPPPPLACIPAHRPPAAPEKADCAVSSATIGTPARSDEPVVRDAAALRAPCAADAGLGATADAR